MDTNTVYCNDRNNENLNYINRENKPNNVYASPTPQNIIYKSESLAKVYDDTFGDAIDDYNSKSARKEDIKYTRHSYFEYLFGVSPNSEMAQKILTSNKRGRNQTRSFNEVFFQIGEHNEFGHYIHDNGENIVTNPKAEIAKEVLEIFYKGGRFQKISDSNDSSFLIRVDEEDEDSIIIQSFEERNPSFRVFMAIEQSDALLSTPYLHIKYVPVGTNYSKGPKKQLGFHRALADMGFTNKQTAFTKWIQKERSILETICNYYGIETNTESQMIRMSDCLTEEFINESTARCKAAEKEANSIIECAKQEASHIIERAISDAEKIIQKAEMEAKEIKAKSKQEYSETKRKFDEIIAKTEKTSNEIMRKSQGDASEIKGQAISKANAIKKEAEESTKALKLKTEQEVSGLLEQADNKMREAEMRVIDKQKAYDDLLKKCVKMEREINFNRSSLLHIAETAKQFPLERFFAPHSEHTKYEMDKNQFDLFIDFCDKIVSLIQNHFTSYYDQKAIEHERERAELLNDQFEKNIQEKERELAEMMNHYSKLVLMQRGYILGTAQKIAEQISARFAEQDRDTQIYQLNSSLNKLEAEEFNKRFNPNFSLPR